MESDGIPKQEQEAMESKANARTGATTIFTVMHAGVGALVPVSAHAQQAANASAKQTWFGGIDPVVRSDKHVSTPAVRRRDCRTYAIFRICTGALALCLGCAAGDGGAAESPQVWLGGVDPIVRASMDPNNTSDFSDLFDPKAQWSKAASRVKVFLTSSQFFSGVRVSDVERKTPDQMLTRMFEDLKRRHIALGVEP